MGVKYSKQRHKPKITKQQIPWLLRGAIRSNNVGTLQYLLSYPNDVDPSMVIDGVCPLNLAIELGHVQMVKILIKAGADIHVPDAPRYPLLQAAMFGRSEIAELLIKSGCAINIRNEHNESALHLLAHQNSQRYISTAEVLLNNNIDPNCLDENGLAPLHKASAEIARVLTLCESTDLNLCSRDGDTPLTAAIKDRRQTFVTSIIDSACEADQRAAIAAAIQAHALTLVNQQSPSTTRYSVRSNSSSSAKDTSSSTSSSNHSSRKHRILPLLGVNNNSNSRQCIRTAANRSSLNSTFGSSANKSQNIGGNNSHLNNNMSSNICDEQRAGFNITSTTNMSIVPGPVSKSISHGCFISGMSDDSLMSQSFTIRLRPGPPSPVTSINPPTGTMLNNSNNITSPPRRLNLERPDKIGMSPLMISADAGLSGLTMVSTLVQHGAELSLADRMGMTALHYACYVGSLPTVQLLYEVALDKPLNMIDIQDKFGRSPICLATCRGHSDVVDYLLAKGADLHLPNKELKSPLYISANFGHLEIVNAFLRHGAQVDQADSHGKTPLYVATYHGRGEIVDLLLHSNACVNTSDKNGRTPLYIAVLHGHLHIARRLIEAGACVNKPDINGLAPLHMAVKFPKLDFPMVKLLLSSGCDPLNLSNFTRWLLSNNIISQSVVMRDAELYDWLKRDEFHVRSLKRLCRNQVQKSLGNNDSLKNKVSALNLPPNLKTYLSMKAL